MFFSVFGMFGAVPPTVQGMVEGDLPSFSANKTLHCSFVSDFSWVF